MKSIISLPVGSVAANCYLLSSDIGNCLIIDPGAEPERIIREIINAGFTPKHILLTHGHHDHIGGVKRLLQHFPEMKVFIGTNDLELLQDVEKSYVPKNYLNKEDYLIDEVELLREGDQLRLDELTIQVLETPGHTKGGVTYRCEKKLFTGDTLFFKGSGQFDLYGGNFDELKQSLKRLAELDGDYEVYPGHGAVTTLAFERNYNPYMPNKLSED